MVKKMADWYFRKYLKGDYVPRERIQHELEKAIRAENLRVNQIRDEQENEKIHLLHLDHKNEIDKLVLDHEMAQARLRAQKSMAENELEIIQKEKRSLEKARRFLLERAQKNENISEMIKGEVIRIRDFFLQIYGQSEGVCKEAASQLGELIGELEVAQTEKGIKNNKGGK